MSHDDTKYPHVVRQAALWTKLKTKLIIVFGCQCSSNNNDNEYDSRITYTYANLFLVTS